METRIWKFCELRRLEETCKFIKLIFYVTRFLYSIIHSYVYEKNDDFFLISLLDMNKNSDFFSLSYRYYIR